MAQTKSLKFARPLPMTVDGCAIFINDQVSVAANPTANDTSDFRIPKGLELSQLKFNVPDMDSSTGMAAKIGFASITGDSTVLMNGAATAVDDDYFRAAGALGQATALIDCQFAPVTFEEDVYLRITWTVAASGTFTAGTIYATMAGNMVGVK